MVSALPDYDQKLHPNTFLKTKKKAGCQRGSFAFLCMLVCVCACNGEGQLGQTELCTWLNCPGTWQNNSQGCRTLQITLIQIRGNGTHTVRALAFSSSIYIFRALTSGSSWQTKPSPACPFQTENGKMLSTKGGMLNCVGTYQLGHSWGSLFPFAAAELPGTPIREKKRCH